jgi:hypothetical protein
MPQILSHSLDVHPTRYKSEADLGTCLRKRRLNCIVRFGRLQRTPGLQVSSCRLSPSSPSPASSTIPHLHSRRRRAPVPLTDSRPPPHPSPPGSSPVDAGLLRTPASFFVALYLVGHLQISISLVLSRSWPHWSPSSVACSSSSPWPGSPSPTPARSSNGRARDSRHHCQPPCSPPSLLSILSSAPGISGACFLPGCSWSRARSGWSWRLGSTNWFLSFPHCLFRSEILFS